MSEVPFLRDALLNASILVECSLFMLLLMFAWTLAHIVDRAFFYFRVKRQTKKFLIERDSALGRHEWSSVLRLCESLTASHLAVVWSRGLREFYKASDCVIFEQEFMAGIHAMRIARSEMREQLRRGLSSISAVSKTAPLVGLFGTCIGILDSFKGYAGNKYGYIAYMATNFAEALVPTTVGLLVGVAATWTFNWQSERLAVLDGEMEIATLELANYLKTKNIPPS
jgi:biopolymer transport protein TolQ